MTCYPCYPVACSWLSSLQHLERFLTAHFKWTIPRLILLEWLLSEFESRTNDKIVTQVRWTICYPIAAWKRDIWRCLIYDSECFRFRSVKWQATLPILGFAQRCQNASTSVSSGVSVHYQMISTVEAKTVWTVSNPRSRWQEIEDGMMEVRISDYPPLFILSRWMAVPSI
jgi:hypothetical protein